MDRLTKRIGEISVDVSSKYFNLEHKELVNELFNRLANYEDLEEQGLLIKLPCKVGDIIYLVDLEFGYDESQVNEIIIDERGILINSDYGDNIPINAEWVVYSKDEAERKIKEHNDKK